MYRMVLRAGEVLKMIFFWHWQDVTGELGKRERERLEP